MMEKPIWEEMGITLGEYAALFNFIQEAMYRGIDIQYQKKVKRMCNIKAK